MVLHCIVRLLCVPPCLCLPVKLSLPREQTCFLAWAGGMGEGGNCLAKRGERSAIFLLRGCCGCCSLFARGMDFEERSLIRISVGFFSITAGKCLFSMLSAFIREVMLDLRNVHAFSSRRVNFVYRCWLGKMFIYIYFVGAIRNVLL